MEVPPTAQSRRFNECDIIGNLDRDDKGNVVVGQAQEGKKGKDGKDTTKYFDKDGSGQINLSEFMVAIRVSKL